MKTVRFNVRTAMAAITLASVASAHAARDAQLDYGPAAAAVAAYVVLECLVPEREPELAVALAVRLADFPETDAKAAALAHGRRVATEMLATKCPREAAPGGNYRSSASRMDPDSDSVITRLDVPGR